MLFSINGLYITNTFNKYLAINIVNRIISLISAISKKSAISIFITTVISTSVSVVSQELYLYSTEIIMHFNPFTTGNCDDISIQSLARKHFFKISWEFLGNFGQHLLITTHIVICDACWNNVVTRYCVTLNENLKISLTASQYGYDVLYYGQICSGYITDMFWIHNN